MGIEILGGNARPRRAPLRRERSHHALELIDAAGPARFEIITPREHASRGAQLSVRALDDAPALHQRLTDAGVVCDFRRPDVVRVAFAPLYNSFEGVARFTSILTGQA